MHTPVDELLAAQSNYLHSVQEWNAKREKNVCYVYTVCMYCMYVLYVCTLCMYCMYVHLFILGRIRTYVCMPGSYPNIYTSIAAYNRRRGIR